jgi:hypothetical protein
MFEPRKTDEQQEVGCALNCSTVGVTLNFDREQDVFEHCAPGHQIRLLKHNAKVGLRPGDLNAINFDDAACLRDQPGSNAKKSGLAAAARPQQAYQLAGVKIERDIVDGDKRRLTGAFKYFMDVFEMSERAS